MNRTHLHVISLSLVAFAISAVATGCGDDDDGIKPLVPLTDVSSADTGTDVNAGPDLEVPEIVEPGPNRLEYVSGQMNAAGGTCVDGCFVRAISGDSVDIAVKLVAYDGRALVEHGIRFDTGGVPSSFASLNSLSAFTDANGIARVVLRSYGTPGSLELTATAGTGEHAVTRTFTVTLDPRPYPDLAISFEYRGRGPVGNFNVRAWKQTAGVPGCAAVHPDVQGSPEPDVARGPFVIGNQIKIETLPGLADDGTQLWTVMVLGPSEGAPYASGCVENVEAVAGTTTNAMVYVLDLPLNFRGTFETVTRTDMLSGGTGTPIGNALVTITDLFTQPGGLIVRWACGSATGTLGTVCNFLVNGQGQLSVLGGVVAGFADGALLDLLAGAIGEDNQQAAEIISEILRDLRFVSTSTFDDEPSTSKTDFRGAWFGNNKTHEEWVSVRFRWKFDPTCKQSPNPSECGWTTIPMEEIYGHRPQAQLSAGIDSDTALHVDLHRVPTLTFGPLISGIVERRLLSLLFSRGATTPIQSWDDLVSVLLGDRECLSQGDCCDVFAERIYDSVPVYVYALAPAACRAAIPLVANVIRNQFARLDGALNLGTKPGEPCMSVDNDADRWVDGYGTQTTMCGWNMFFETNSGPYFIENSWRSAVH